jgi:hypothetical protein
VKNTVTTGVMLTVSMMIDVNMMIATATITIARRLLLYLHRKQGIPTMHSRMLTNKSTSSSVAVKQPRATDSNDQTQGRSSKSILKLRNLYVGRSTPSLSPEKAIGCTYLTSGPTC